MLKLRKIKLILTLTSCVLLVPIFFYSCARYIYTEFLRSEIDECIIYYKHFHRDFFYCVTAILPSALSARVRE